MPAPCKAPQTRHVSRNPLYKLDIFLYSKLSFLLSLESLYRQQKEFLQSLYYSKLTSLPGTALIISYPYQYNIPLMEVEYYLVIYLSRKLNQDLQDHLKNRHLISYAGPSTREPLLVKVLVISLYLLPYIISSIDIRQPLNYLQFLQLLQNAYYRVLLDYLFSRKAFLTLKS